jgi:hypothetical protein
VWIDTSDVESIISRSTSVKRTASGPVQAQYETFTMNTAVPDDQGGKLVLIASHFSRDKELLEAAVKATRKGRR